MLCIHQYIVCMLYKAGPELYIAVWLSHHNHRENKDQEISGMNVSIHTINTTVDVLICTSIEDIKATTEEEAELKILKRSIIRGRPHTKEMVEPGVEKTLANKT